MLACCGSRSMAAPRREKRMGDRVSDTGQEQKQGRYPTATGRKLAVGGLPLHCGTGSLSLSLLGSPRVGPPANAKTAFHPGQVAGQETETDSPERERERMRNRARARVWGSAAVDQACLIGCARVPSAHPTYHCTTDHCPPARQARAWSAARRRSGLPGQLGS